VCLCLILRRRTLEIRPIANRRPRAERFPVLSLNALDIGLPPFCFLFRLNSRGTVEEATIIRDGGSWSEWIALERHCGGRKRTAGLRLDTPGRRERASASADGRSGLPLSGDARFVLVVAAGADYRQN
jgi:hypothetical protein